jgi:hypothetical protein
VNLRRDLPNAGFVDVACMTSPNGARPNERCGKKRSRRMRATRRSGPCKPRAARSLEAFDSLRRVFATATAP